jgi:hypothetical protein
MSETGFHDHNRNAELVHTPGHVASILLDQTCYSYFVERMVGLYV